MQKLIDFVYNLIISGEILMAKLLRAKIIEKANMLKQKRLAMPINLSSLPIDSNPPKLLELKSTELGKFCSYIFAQQNIRSTGFDKIFLRIF